MAFAVAGGQSRRMGRDKALLPWGETDLLGHTLARLCELTGDVRILSGATPRHADRGAPVVTDPAPDLGPLAGLWAALESAAERPVLLLGVDLPLVPPPLLMRLVEKAGEFDAVVPVSTRGPEPLCAVYGPACMPPVRAAVDRGDLKMTSFWPDVRVRQLDGSDLADLGPPDELFLNVNSPDDYTRALKSLA